MQRLLKNSFSRVHAFALIGGLLGAGFLSGFPSALGQDTANAAIPLPPLAWSSWNSFSNTIDSAITMQQAQALISTGLHKAGYDYVNIDEGWWLGERDSEGHFIVDPKLWPAIAPGDKAGDMSNIVRYIHSLGLKAGIYTDAGKEGCSMFPDVGPAYFHVGSEGYYEQDFLQFAKWGFDYVKVDWCGGDKENLNAEVQYGEIARAIALAERATGKRLYYSICNWGKQSPWTWGPGIGGSPQDIWRVSGDIVPPIVAGSANAWRKAAFDKMFQNYDQGIHPEAQHTGYYNDPDMMVLGMPGFNYEQNRLHMSMWVMSGAPLIIGADLTKLDDSLLRLLRNPDAVAIDQDALGLQDVKVKELSAGLEIWSKMLSTPGSRAVMLLNRTYFPAPMSVEWADLGLKSAAAKVRNVWADKDEDASSKFEATVAAQNAVLLIVRGSEGDAKHYSPSLVDNSEKKGFTLPQLVFDHIPGVTAPFAPIRIAYTNDGRETKILNLFVNGETGTSVAFPPTKGTTASVWIQTKLDRNGNTNKLTFDSPPQSEIKIRSIDVY
jgi:Alpha galactosidase A/Alpha galactosidase C-terminal beta sandwich domain